LRVLRLGGSGIIKTAQTTTQFKPEISQGLDILGARRASDVSSRKAGDTFTKLNLQVQHRRSIPPAFQLNLKGALQFATEKLTPQEEFSLGGMNSVRGYPVGDYYGDNAIQASVELLASPTFLPDEIKLPCAARPLKDDITALLFIDYGYGTKRGRIQGEREAFKLASAGMGIRIYLYDQALVRLEWGYPLAMGDDPISEGPCLRLHFSFNFEDRIHREVIRISKAPKEAKAKK
jgi:hemolysin activation/secretion protein